MPTINKTQMHSGYVEAGMINPDTTLDRFWLAGARNINSTLGYQTYDTSTFSTVFPQTTNKDLLSRNRNSKDENGEFTTNSKDRHTITSE